jgi:glucosamine--fructose-6-phosphate aminotransferase (isomerizing)
MCGIIGYLGNKNSIEVLIPVLNLLQNRGYDSVGIATIEKNKNILISKFASLENTCDCMLILNKKTHLHSNNTIGIGHTRWATHGKATDANAHPHIDHKNRIAIVHNGTITNYMEIKQMLLSKNILFKSDTDTEVIVQLISYYMYNNDVITSIRETMKVLKGTWAFVIIDKCNPNQLLVCKNGSPIVIGLGENEKIICSEVQAMSNYTNKYIALKDNEICIITKDNIVTDCKYEIQTFTPISLELSPDPYKHWTVKEIYEQYKSSTNAIKDRIKNDKVSLIECELYNKELRNIENMLISGCGSSLYAGLYGAQIFRLLEIFNTVQVIDAGEFNKTYIPKAKAGLVVLSQSGETKDTHRAIMVVNKQMPTISLINKTESLISKSTLVNIYLHAGRENAVASTKAFTSQILCLIILGLWFSNSRNEKVCQNIINNITNTPDLIQKTLDNNHSKCKELADKLNNVDSIYVLGKGLSYPVAMESALKIKEISYIHAEGFGGSAMKHGPLALIDKNTPIIIFMFNDKHLDLMKVITHEIKSRNAYVIVITDDSKVVDHSVDDYIVIPSNGYLTPLLGIIPLQILAYELSIRRNINPDRPKNLAKTVTVD